MARPDAYIGTSEVADRLVELKQCPITCGRPTKMTESGFLALCERHRVEDGVWKYNHRRHPAEKKGWCQVCQGKQRPKELQLVSIAQLQRVERVKKQQPKTTTNGDDMATKKVRALCEGGCGQTLQVANNYGVKMCSTCAAAHSHVKNHKETVAAAIRRTDMLGWYVQQLAGETVTVKGESATLDAIAAAVGYVGESPDGLVGAVMACVEKATARADWMACFPPDVIKAVGFDEVQGVQEFELAIIQQAAQLEDLQRNPQSVPGGYIGCCVECRTSDALDAIRRHTGTEGKDFDQVVLAVAQAEAILEALVAVVGSINPFEIPVVVNSLASAFEKTQKLTDSRVERINVLADRVSELERVNLVNEQIFTQLRELVDADGLSNAELPSAISSVIYSRKESFSELVASPDTRPSIDGHLLDLALDAWRGEIQGLDPDRIEVIREAAR
jgi:hypothetical protein